MNEDFLLLGIAGEFASGKTHIADLFRERGHTVLSIDDVFEATTGAAELVFETLRNSWDDFQFPEFNQAAADKLTEIITNDSRRKTFFDGLICPIIHQKLASKTKVISGLKFAILETPCLFTFGLNGICHAVLFVDAPQKVRENRALQINLTPEQVKLIDEERKEHRYRWRSNFVIVNDGNTDLQKEIQKTINGLSSFYRKLSEIYDKDDDGVIVIAGLVDDPYIKPLITASKKPCKVCNKLVWISDTTIPQIQKQNYTPHFFCNACANSILTLKKSSGLQTQWLQTPEESLQKKKERKQAQANN